MRVLIILLFTFFVFVITNIIQCIDVPSTFNLRTQSSSGQVLRMDDPKLFNIQPLHTSAAYVQRTKDYNVTSVTEDMCYKCNSSVDYKFLCVLVSLVTVAVPIRIIFKPTKLEEKMIKKFDHLLAILNTINIGVIATDSEHNITYINNAAAKMCGIGPDDVAIGKTIGDIVRFEVNQIDVEDLQDLTDLSVNLQEVNCNKEDFALVKTKATEGEFLDVQLISSPLPLKDGTVGAVMVLLDVTSARAQIKELSHRAAHDALTGLPNRDSFEKCLRYTMTMKEERAIVFVDLDSFKSVNDTAGHAAGDALLTQVARLMKTQIRKTDFVARLGGDEFGLILFNCGLHQAEALMNDLVKQINDYQFRWEGKLLRFGASAGITKVRQVKDIGEVLAEADEACYKAKHRGKGQVCVYTEC